MRGKASWWIDCMSEKGGAGGRGANLDAVEVWNEEATVAGARDDIWG